MKTSKQPGKCLLALLIFSPIGAPAATQVIAWGSNTSQQTNVPPGLTNIVAVAGGGENSLALRSSGVPVQWGLINNVPAWAVPTSEAIAVSAGADPFNLALRNSGTVVAWGGNDYGCSSVPPGLTGVVAIAAGYVHGLAVKSDGTAVAWGDNSSGQTNVPAWLSNVVAVSAGEFHSLALRSDGTVVGWGDNVYGESTGAATTTFTNGVVRIGGKMLTNAVAIAAGVNRFSLALKEDGSVVGWGFGALGETTPPPLTNAVAIAAGSDFALALNRNGTVAVWGNSPFGATSIPPGLTNIVAIGAGTQHALALASDEPPVFGGDILEPKLSQGVFSCSVATQMGRVYRLEFRNPATADPWAGLPLTVGTGGLIVLTDTGANDPQRIYRVRRW